MLTIIGKIGCVKCVELKEQLSKDGVEFQYLVFDRLPIEQKKKYAKIIREENEGHFPLVIK